MGPDLVPRSNSFLQQENGGAAAALTARKCLAKSRVMNGQCEGRSKDGRGSRWTAGVAGRNSKDCSGISEKVRLPCQSSVPAVLSAEC